jgi:hypothetical protein
MTRRRLGTEKPRWSTVVPLLPPVGACIGRKNNTTPANLTISRFSVPIVTTVPPSVSAQNFRCASMFVVFK